MKTINITISGKCGSGKTTMARDIATTLIKSGHCVYMHDDEGFTRLSNLRKKVSLDAKVVNIRTEQERR